MTKRESDLDVLAHNIKVWRKGKKSKASRIPNVLVEEIYRLCEVHGAATVCEHVGLSNPYRWQHRVKERASSKASTKKILPVASGTALGKLAVDALSAKPGNSTPNGTFVEVKGKDLTITFHNYPALALLSALREAGLC